VQFRRSRGAVNARRGVARNGRIRHCGPSSREDRSALATRVVSIGKAAGVPGVTPALLIRALVLPLWVFGFILLCLVWSSVSRRRGWSRGAGARVPTLNVRGRSKVGKAKPVRKDAAGPCRWRVRGRRARPSAVRAALTALRPKRREPTPPPLLPSERARNSVGREEDSTIQR
jgi:hypothetical protein